MGFPDYEVSSSGSVRSIPRTDLNGRKLCGKVLKARPLPKTGYLQVFLRKDGRSHPKYVHDLVTAAFIGPKPPGQWVRHGPAGVPDNSLANLCYGTVAENHADKLRDGTLRRGERVPWARLTNEQAVLILQLLEDGANPAILAREYGLSRSAVRSLGSGRSWKWLHDPGHMMQPRREL